MTRVIYTGYFVNNPDELIKHVPVRLRGADVKLFAHHVTKSFRPPEGLSGTIIGRKYTLRVYAEVITDRVHVMLVESTGEALVTVKKYPHITIATAQGAAPTESDQAIDAAIMNNTVKLLEQPFTIEVTEGYFDGDRIHTTL